MVMRVERDKGIAKVGKMEELLMGDIVVMADLTSAQNYGERLKYMGFSGAGKTTVSGSKGMETAPNNTHKIYGFDLVTGKVTEVVFDGIDFSGKTAALKNPRITTYEPTHRDYFVVRSCYEGNTKWKDQKPAVTAKISDHNGKKIEKK